MSISAMDLLKRVLTFLTFFICCGALAFLTAAFSTHYWLQARPVRVGFDVANLSEELDIGKFRGEVNFGLFKGEKRLNHGFGLRPYPFFVKNEMWRNPQFMIFGLWLFTVLALALALLFGVVSAVFAVINTVMTPVEVITGLMGLYLWNGIAALLSLSTALSWVGQFHLRLNQNIMSREELDSHWTSKDRATYGYSFWFVLVALALFLFNVFLVSIAVHRPCSGVHWPPRAVKGKGDKNPEGAIMLY